MSFLTCKTCGAIPGVTPCCTDKPIKEAFMNNHISLDLETMGTAPGCAIVAIGAARFDPMSDTIEGVFYRTIDLQSCLDAGLVVDAGTLKWWMEQSDDARKALFKDTVPLHVALADFSEWVARGYGTPQVWGNGSDFDNAILACAYKAMRKPTPWKFWDSRDLRTVCYLTDNLREPVTQVGVHHNAVDDAVYQAKVCQSAHKALRLQDLKPFINEV